MARAEDTSERSRTELDLSETEGTGGRRVELSVRSREGAPIERFAVATIAEVGADVLAFLPEEDRPGGLVTLGAPTGSFRVEVRANGWVPARLGPFSGERPPARLECRLEARGDCILTGHLVIDGKPAEGWLASLRQERAEIADASSFVEPGAFRLVVDEPGSYRLSLRSDTSDPSARLVILDAVELHEGPNHWSLELETGTLEGTLGSAVSGEDELVFYCWERGKLQCLAPLVPSEGSRFRCARAPAGRGAIVRLEPGKNLEEQTPVVLREVVVEAGKATSVEL